MSRSPATGTWLAIATGMWVVPVLASMVLSGCLMPPQIDEVGELVNRPPRIVPGSIAPHPTLGPVTVAPDCTVEFSAAVSDLDGDVLFYRVFDDYFRSTSRRPPSTPVPLDPTTNSAVIVFTREGDSFDDTNPHTVEILVADRDFTTALRQPEGRVLADEEGLTASFMWSMVVDDAASCEEGGF